jgi:hypothetical protein
MFEFTAPAAPGTTLKPADIEGHLLVVVADEYIPEIQTSMGASEAVRVTVHDITTGETAEGVLWFSKVLVSSLKSMLGRQILAVMGRGVAKVGQSAPWVLEDASHSTEAIAAATKYLTGRQAKSFAPPAPDKPVETALPSAADNLEMAIRSLQGGGLTS